MLLDQIAFLDERITQLGARAAVISQRLKLSGMRWTVPGATSIATLRCQKASNRWEQIWQRPHSQAALANLARHAS